MGDITSTCNIQIHTPNMGAKTLVIKTLATATTSDTIVLTLKNYGIASFMGCLTLIHSSAESVITLETTNAATTAVSSGVLTLTIPGGGAAERTIVIYGL